MWSDVLNELFDLAEFQLPSGDAARDLICGEKPFERQHPMAYNRADPPGFRSPEEPATSTIKLHASWEKLDARFNSPQKIQTSPHAIVE